MHVLSEPDGKTLGEIDLRIRIRETAEVDYAQFDLCVREACAAAEELTKKCEQLTKEGAHAFCTSSEDIVSTSAKQLVDRWIEAMPNVDIKRVHKEIEQVATTAHASGESFSALRLESVMVGMAEELRQASRTKLLSAAGRQITGAPDGGTVIWLSKPVYGSRTHHTTEYSIHSSLADFESAVAVILGGADPLTVKPLIDREVLPNSLAGGWSIFPAKKRKEKTIPELRLWTSRAEATFTTAEDAALVMTECSKARAQEAAQDAANAHNNPYSYYP